MVQRMNPTTPPAHDEDGWERIKGECPKCKKKKGWCRRSTDGTKIACRFQPEGAVHSGTDKNGSPFYIHRLTPEDNAPKPRRKPRSKPAGPDPGLADVDTRHEIYGALIEALSLAEDHRVNLGEGRKFPAGEPERRGYRSLPEGGIRAIVARLVERFGAKTLTQVPGFHLVGNEVRFSYWPGLLIPVRDERGRIVALQSRRDETREDEPKYPWVSSKSKGGPGPGSPPHVPLGCPESETWRLTEGHLKADLATILSGIPTIGAPGAMIWAPCVPILKAVGCRVVRLAFDADAITKKEVAGALLACSRTLRSKGFEVELERWDLADGKGIDDLLADDKQAEVLAGEAVEEGIIEIARSAGCAIQGDDPDVEPTGPADGAERPSRRGGRGVHGGELENHAQVLLRIAAAAPAVLFHSPDGTPFATITVGDHAENHPVQSKSFARWLRRGFYAECGTPPSSEGLQAALGLLEAMADYDGPTEPVYVRVAGLDDPTDPDNPVYLLDLCNERWEAVQITRDGWQVVAAPPVKFRRTKSMLPLPTPVPGGSIDELRKFFNVATDDDWRLVVAFVTAGLRPCGPYPIVAINGEQGSAKSTMSRALRRAIDPHVTLLRCEPKEVRDLMIAATNSWVQALDNISSLPVWLSDALCRLATGGGFATRTLYANDEETHFDAMRPVLLNGIEDVATRCDLLDRCLVLSLPTIPDDRRREEKPFWREFEAAHPGILGALLDAVVGGLRMLPSVKLDRLPRMADFARWGEAVGRALGWDEGAFLRAYESNRASANEVAIEASPVALAVRGLMAEETTWEGPASELLVRLAGIAGEATTRDRTWPTSANALSGKLRRAAPALRKCGVEVLFSRSTKRRTIVVRAVDGASVAETPSSSSSSSCTPPPTEHNEQPDQDFRRNDGQGASENGDRQRSSSDRPGSSWAETPGNRSNSDGGPGLEAISPSADDDHDDHDDLSPTFGGPDGDGEFQGEVGEI